MANTDAPYGLRPVNYSSGHAYTGAVKRYKKEASVILAAGDPVVLTGTSESGTGIALITRATGSEGSPSTITGVVVGIDPVRTALNQTYLAAADTGYVLVADDPHLVFSCQEDADGGALAITDVGRGVDLIVGNADTTRGQSIVELDSSSAAGSGVQCRILECVQREKNTVASANAEYLIQIVEHTYGGTHTLI